MDLNDLRTAVMLASFALFVALMWHTWSRRRGGEHAAAAVLPFLDEADEQRQVLSARRQGERHE